MTVMNKGLEKSSFNGIKYRMDEIIIRDRRTRGGKGMNKGKGEYS